MEYNEGMRESTGKGSKGGNETMTRGDILHRRMIAATDQLSRSGVGFVYAACALGKVFVARLGGMFPETTPEDRVVLIALQFAYSDPERLQEYIDDQASRPARDREYRVWR